MYYLISVHVLTIIFKLYQNLLFLINRPLNKCIIANSLFKNICYFLKSTADQMLFSAGKHRWLECGPPTVHIFQPVHLHLSGDLSFSVDGIDLLNVDPQPGSVRVKHFRTVKLLKRGQIQSNLATIYINKGYTAYYNLF